MFINVIFVWYKCSLVDVGTPQNHLINMLHFMCCQALVKLSLHKHNTCLRHGVSQRTPRRKLVPFTRDRLQRYPLPSRSFGGGGGG